MLAHLPQKRVLVWSLTVVVHDSLVSPPCQGSLFQQPATYSLFSPSPTCFLSPVSPIGSKSGDLGAFVPEWKWKCVHKVPSLPQLSGADEQFGKD